MNFRFNVSWTEVANILIEADSREKAESILEKMPTYQLNGHYLDDSFVIES